MPKERAEAGIGLDQAGYDSLFLTAADLPEMRCVQDARSHGHDPADETFGRQQGRFAGFQAWMADGDKAVWRLVDIRFVFPTAAAAQAYHRESLRRNSEGHAAVQGAPLVGDSCMVFGGTEANPILPELMMTAYIYVFRIRNVVVKLFVAQGPELPPGTLTPGDVAALAERIRARLES